MSKEFPKGVRACGPLAPALRDGLQALKTMDRRRVTAKSPSRLTGSVDMDSVLSASLPDKSRWDYGVGHAATANARDEAHWIEVHPCNDGEVKVVTAKLAWLRGWLSANAKDLHCLPARFVWVSSGSTALSPKSPARRKLAQLGLLVAGSRYTIA